MVLMCAIGQYLLSTLLLTIPDTPWDCHKTADQLGWCQGGQWGAQSYMAVPDTSCLRIMVPWNTACWSRKSVLQGAMFHVTIGYWMVIICK